jgi:hypothetical protein
MLNRPHGFPAAALLRSRPSPLLRRIGTPTGVGRIRLKGRRDQAGGHGMALRLAGAQRSRDCSLLPAVNARHGWMLVAGEQVVPQRHEVLTQRGAPVVRF